MELDLNPHIFISTDYQLDSHRETVDFFFIHKRTFYDDSRRLGERSLNIHILKQ